MPKNGIAGLSRQQRRCLQLVGMGLTSPEIAHELGISASTVNVHLSAATKKLGAPNRRRAAALLKGEDTSSDPRQKIFKEIVRLADEPFCAASPITGTVRDVASGAIFDASSSSDRDRAHEAREDDRSWMSSALRVAALVLIATIVIIFVVIALGPLAESALRLANTISPYRN